MKSTDQELNALYSKLIARAGLSTDDVKRGMGNEHFNTIISALSDIHAGKQVLYGDYIKNNGSDAPIFCLMSHFFDIKRKYIRSENFIKDAAAGKKHNINSLIDTYSDMAVYAILGIQLIVHLDKRRQENVKSINPDLH